MLIIPRQSASIFFFFNDTATTEIYTLSLHDALPISSSWPVVRIRNGDRLLPFRVRSHATPRSEEHTSELQSPCNLVCRLLLEKKKKIQQQHTTLRNLLHLLIANSISATLHVSYYTPP